MSFTKTVLSVAANDSDRIAITDVDGAITYGEIVQRAEEAMNSLDSILAGVSPETIGDAPVIMLSLERAFDAASFVAMFAGFKTITSVLDPLWPIEHKVNALQKAEAAVVITDDNDLILRLADLAWGGVAVTPKEFFKAGQKSLAVTETKKYAVRADAEPFILIFTSGTTDAPKAFLRTRKSWRVNAQVSEKYLFAKPKMRTLAPGPLAYSLTLYALVEVLATGGTIYLQSRFMAVSATKVLDENKIERFVAVPAVLAAITMAAKRLKSRLPSLKYAVVGGAGLNSNVRRDFEELVPGAILLNYYGAAEIGFIAYSLSDEDSMQFFSGVRAQIRDVNGEPLPDGESGTLFVRVASQGDRYIAGAEPDAAQITGEDGWSSVNDQAKIVAGKLFLLGRAGDIVVIGGHNVSLAQIDRAVQTALQTDAAVAVGIPDKHLGTSVALIIEAETFKSLGLTKNEILVRISGELPPQFVPKYMYLAESIPRTVGGKIRRNQALVELLGDKYERQN